MGQCRATKRDGSRCTQTVTTANGLCWAHDPANASKRRRMASRAGSSKGGGEIAEIKKQLKELAAGVLSGVVGRSEAAVVNQILNTRARLIELERKIREQEELEVRLEALESVLKVRSAR
jgi:BMFP domain-containing protein YqiC